MARRYWLMKTEPAVFSIDDLERAGTTRWEGVRNFQARNLLRDEVQRGDLVLVYHSSTEPPGVAGIGRVTRAAYDDPTALDPSSEYYDPRATPSRPIWVAVDVAFVAKLATFVPLDTLRPTPGLEGMLVTKRGQRLSVQPVAPEHFRIVRRLGRPARARRSGPQGGERTPARRRARRAKG